MLPVLEDSKSTMEVLGVTALALGQIHVGTCDGTVAEAILQQLLTQTEENLATPHARNMALALGLLFLGKQQAAEVTLATLETLGGTFGKIACILVDCCAYAGELSRADGRLLCMVSAQPRFLLQSVSRCPAFAKAGDIISMTGSTPFTIVPPYWVIGTGNVLKIQKLLHTCSEHFDTEKEGGEGSDAHQAFATLGISMIAMGEEVGVEMALRSMNHLLQYGETGIRRAVPVAMALLCTSNPVLGVMDTLSKLSHDVDAEVAYNSVRSILSAAVCVCMCVQVQDVFCGCVCTHQGPEES